MLSLTGVNTNRNPTPAEKAVHTCISRMLLSSEQLFFLALSHYKKSGRGACVVLFDSLDQVEHATKPVVFKYYDLCDLLELRYPPVCELAKVYNVSMCFVLLVQVYSHPLVTSAAVIAHKDHGSKAVQFNSASVLGGIDQRLLIAK